jgi:hypothetical protein
MIFSYFLVFVVAVSTWLCFYVARRKNLNVQYWVLLGALAGPFAIPFVLLAKSKADSTNQTTELKSHT